MAFRRISAVIGTSVPPDEVRTSEKSESPKVSTVAEGVETEPQWQYLKSRHANQVQGFLFCQPRAIADLELWHAEWVNSDKVQAAGAA